MRVWFSLIILSGCGAGYTEEFEDGLRIIRTTVSTKSNGLGDFKIKFEPGETAFLATAHSPSIERQVHMRQLLAPGNVILFDALEEVEGVRTKTNAGFLGDAASLNWPVKARDVALVDNDKYTLQIGLADLNATYVAGDVDLDILIKQDAGLQGGELDVAIAYAGSVGDDPTMVAATEAAVEHWRDLYAPLGITLNVEYYDYSVGQFEAPGVGSGADFEAIAEQTPIRSINVVIAEQITGLTDVYGITGDIPAPLVATTKSAVLVSGLYASGADAVFTDQEIRLYGETLAHESGHYLGLFHVVETSWAAWDDIDDTSECQTESDCASDHGRNLMFPFPLCGITGVCTPQEELTSGQGGVTQRYVGVD